jgi:hypothetical protein
MNPNTEHKPFAGKTNSLNMSLVNDTGGTEPSYLVEVCRTDGVVQHLNFWGDLQEACDMAKTILSADPHRFVRKTRVLTLNRKPLFTRHAPDIH